MPRTSRVVAVLVALALLSIRLEAAIAFTHLETTGSTTDATSFTTGSVTPTADRLQLLAVVNTKSSTATLPTVSGDGLTWVQVATCTYDSSTAKRLTLFRALGASPSTGSLTIDFGGTTQTGIGWSWVEVSGTDTSGTNGSGAIVQAVCGTEATTATPSVTLSAFGNAANATYGAFGIGTNPTCTAGTGFTKAGSFSHTTPASAICSEYQTANDTSVDLTWSASNTGLGIGVEIKDATATGGTKRQMLLGVGDGA
jgi:hypothetical protein